MKSLLLAFCAVLILAFSAEAMPKQGPFTRDDVLHIYQTAVKKMGRPGTLKSVVDLSEPYDPYLIDGFWYLRHTHYLHYMREGTNLALRMDRKNAGAGVTVIVYSFFDSDYDGKVDEYRRDVYFIVDDEGTILSYTSPDESLDIALAAWSKNIPNPQQLYENELAYWYYRLIHADEEAN